MSTSTTSRRVAGKGSTGAAAPLINAALLTAALGYGVWLLVDRGRVSWPPHELFAGLHTFAGCLALVGPLVLSRRDGAEGGVGELAWMTGGLLVWIHNIAALFQGRYVDHSWVTPLGVAPMGLAILAVLIAGWRLRGGSGGRNWGWMNVVGWLLGVFWVGLALSTFLPPDLVANLPR